LSERVTNLEKQVAIVTSNVNNLVRELQDFKNEMRASRTRQDEDMREIRTALNNNVRNMFITMIIGVGAMVVAVFMK
ncbi:MAG: hypothetical protein IJQ82_12735, partial [Selenomonadaceae bacterium]|nr:hypothetical protein [Selenomonadaceae bacterium]